MVRVGSVSGIQSVLSSDPPICGPSEAWASRLIPAPREISGREAIGWVMKSPQINPNHAAHGSRLSNRALINFGFRRSQQAAAGSESSLTVGGAGATKGRS